MDLFTAYEFGVVSFEYSGHGTRHKEPLYNSFTDLADDIFDLFKREYKGGEYALFGYSMGTITLIEVLKRIMEGKDIPLPKHVFLAAHEPKTKIEYADYSIAEADSWVKTITIGFGAVPETLINNKSFWRVYLPIFSSDYSIIGKYRFEDINLIARIPATVFYSETDTPLQAMKHWKRIFVENCEFFQFEGSHFFILQNHKEMAEIIRKRMGGRIN